MKEVINILNEKWRIHLNSSKQLSFSYAVPKKKSTWRNDPMWHTWDLVSPTVDNDEDEYTYDQNISKTTISPFIIKSALLKATVALIKKSNVTYFYFTPSDERLGTIYFNIADKFSSLLGREWTYQIINKNWFYFFKTVED